MKVLLMFVVFLMSLPVFAVSSRTSDSLYGKRGMKSLNLNPLLANPTSATSDIKNSLLEGVDSEFEITTALQWPPLPRAWLEYASTEYITSNTFLGFKANPFLFSFKSTVAAKLSFDFKYQVKSSFVVITSRSISSENSKSLFKFDEDKMKSYLTVSESTPMVGLCIYEVQFAYDKGAIFNFEVLGSGQSLNKGKIESITNTHFSNFFQIKADSTETESTNSSSLYSIDSYKDKCNRIYKQKIEQQVNTDISKQIMSLVFHNHPKSQCTPDSETADLAGDSTCKDWFNSEVHPMVKKMTVPRCVLKAGGIHACELRAKAEDISCPLYVNPDDSYSDVPINRASKIITTRNSLFPNYVCDEKAHLTCEVISKPTFIGKIQLGAAKARCRKQT